MFTASLKELMKVVPDKYHFLLNDNLFELRSYDPGASDSQYFYNINLGLINTKFTLFISFKKERLDWYKTNDLSAFSIVSVLEVLENIPESIGTELLFHLDVLA